MRKKNQEKKEGKKKERKGEGKSELKRKKERRWCYNILPVKVFIIITVKSRCKKGT